ncbi:glycosyltransferase [Mesorhizobium sp. ES1-1]|uniref:glycosyltransferase n=1 Tax=Mesorhizobium sp. ES1-1 TaxID=2876629 RepID=UPI001CCF8613|nr:glycosyltransferase [Mesorhizobium sp. ES1-1]MBZ9677816.1 glycosyltransferase [Mesorhizobium sp. ES1-1]
MELNNGRAHPEIPLPVTPRTVLIVEPHLEDQAGHPYRYVRAVAAAFSRSGWGSTVLAHRAYCGPKTINAAEIRPAFPRTYYERTDRLGGSRHALEQWLRSVRQDLKGLLKGRDATPGRLALMAGAAALAVAVSPAILVLALAYALWRVAAAALGTTPTRNTVSPFAQSVAREIERTKGELSLFVPTATPAMLAELLVLPLFLTRPPPRMACVFHEDPRLYADWYRPLDLDSLAHRLRGSGWKDGIRFFATNPQLAADMSSLLDAPVCDFGDVFEEQEVAALGSIAAGRHPPPQDLPGKEAAFFRELSKRKKSGRRLAVCLGAIRPDKGGTQLAAMVSALDAGAEGFDLVLQAARWPDALRSDCLALSVRRDVVVVEHPLSDAGYLGLLELSDVVLLPYDAEAYRCRVSRVFIEAALAGRPVLASRGISAQTDPEPSSARFIADWNAWPAEATELLASSPGDVVARRARERAAGASWNRWSEAATWLCTRSAPLIMPKPVLYVRPSWYLTGSATVFDQHLRSLADRGIPVIEVIIVPDRVRRALRKSWRAALDDRASSAAVLTCLSGRRSGGVGFMQRKLMRLRTRGRSQAVLLAERSRLSPLPPAVRRIARDRGFSFILVNHYFHLPLIASFGHRFPVWLETHDLQARQIMLRGEINPSTGHEDPFEELVADEMAYVSRADVIGAINVDEEAFFRARLGPHQSKVLLCQPSVSLPPSQEIAPGCDVLIVASDNHANVIGLSWFVQHVLPKLGRERSIKVVGNMGTVAQREGLLHDQVDYIGTVKTLAPHYRSARLVAMPVAAGAGIAIKALEALEAGRPIVATPLAYRGLPTDFQPPEPKPTADASEFAATIERLLDDSQAHDRAVMSTLQANLALGIKERFEAQMAGAVERLAKCEID